MKRKNRQVFWLILVIINIVAVIYAVVLCNRGAYNSAQNVSVTVLLGIALLLVVTDAASLIVDYRRWYSNTRRHPPMDSQEIAVNREIMICADGAALVMYYETGRKVAREEILCNGPTAMLKAGLVKLENIGEMFCQPEA